MRKYKHVVFLLGPGFPKPSAVANCGLNVAKELSKFSRVSLIFIGPKDAASNLSLPGFSNVHCLFVDTTYLKLHRLLSNKKSLFGKLSFFVIRFLGVISKFLSLTTISQSLVNNIQEALSNINSACSIDHIVACSFPFENVVAAYKFCQSNIDVKYSPYLFDDFLNSNTLHVNSFNKYVKHYFNKNLFHICLKKSSFILAMNSFKFVEDFDCSNVFYVEHPLLIEPVISNYTNLVSLQADNYVIYAGNFLSGHVEPDYLILLIQQAGLQKQNFVFFGSGNAYGKVIELAERSEKVFYKGFIQRDKLDVLLSKSVAAVSVGEVLGKQLSSKIFDYISHCLPILHIAYHYDCQTAKVLKKYPLACVIYVEDDFSINLNKFKDFIVKADLMAINFRDAAEIYPDALPSFTSNLILENCMS